MATAYVLKVILAEIEPPIWRRVVVPCDYALDRVHVALQSAMGWLNSHLHAFEIAGRTFEHPDLEPQEDSLDERALKLGALKLRDRFVYRYDFGDDWEHDVRIEGVEDADRPRCEAGGGGCPPEDVGGPLGYADFVAAWADAAHPAHERMREWAGPYFSLEFDLAAANACLSDAFPIRRAKRKPGPRAKGRKAP